ncbi:hypothetical protein [Staphylococcus ratti]|uniref:Uncharacterized protein n=1 Tax=Staphylococcus ratti TaxID=2892440 RepID=A0ABY3PBB3_9STAP|nr:hypothetical protein [Staphylococcus ratti]UEX89563.1 hypothetical protein LN051_08285 [Staphylococcus ratti]
MTAHKKLSNLEILIILIGTALLPVMSLMIGVAIFSFVIPTPSMVTQMYGERLCFALSALAIGYVLNKINVITIVKKEIFTVKHLKLYSLQIMIIVSVLYYFQISEDAFLILLMFIMLNYLIA